MRLNLPIMERVADSKSILLAGVGGGFDVFGGLPLYFSLIEAGKTVYLANYSFSDHRIAGVVSHPQVLIEGLLTGAYGKVEIPLSYYPEGYLAEWFKVRRDEDITVWMFGKVGAAPLAEAYQKLIDHLEIDTIIGVDCGVDSLMCGDEDWAGSLVGDAVSLAAINAAKVQTKLLACIGFGTEVEDMVGHHHTLENIAALTKINAFLGVCALLPQMEVFQLYESAVRYVWQQPDHQTSHIHTRVIPAVYGEFGDFHQFPYDRQVELFLSPLMSLYWFFEADAVIQRNLFIEGIKNTRTSDQAKDLYERIRQGFKIRPKRPIPY